MHDDEFGRDVCLVKGWGNIWKWDVIGMTRVPTGSCIIGDSTSCTTSRLLLGSVLESEGSFRE